VVAVRAEVCVITADTITDEQIRELLRSSLHDEPTYWACRQALDETVGSVTADQIHYARGLCADSLNARASKPADLPTTTEGAI
jgi:hypothetical protein